MSGVAGAEVERLPGRRRDRRLPGSAPGGSGESAAASSSRRSGSGVSLAGSGTSTSTRLARTAGESGSTISAAGGGQIGGDRRRVDRGRVRWQQAEPQSGRRAELGQPQLEATDGGIRLVSSRCGQVGRGRSLVVALVVVQVLDDRVGHDFSGRAIGVDRVVASRRWSLRGSGVLNPAIKRACVLDTACAGGRGRRSRTGGRGARRGCSEWIPPAVASARPRDERTTPAADVSRPCGSFTSFRLFE